MVARASIFFGALVAIAHAQDYWFIPEGVVGSFCDGIVRPEWAECDEKYLDWINSQDLKVGPGFLEGTTFTGETCQLRYVRCAGPDGEFIEPKDTARYEAAKFACEELGGGGVYRSGDLCTIVEDPNNPFVPRDVKRAVEADMAAHDVRTESNDSAAPALVAGTRSLERRQSGCAPIGGECDWYVESSFAANIRGQEYRVCNNVIPDGGNCIETNSVTVTDTYTAGVEVTAGIEGVISATGSFSTSYSEAITQSLATTIVVDCPGGSGYVVWYPFMEVSSGSCYVGGTCNSIGNGSGCQDATRTSCTGRIPVVREAGVLSGEYDVVCI